MVDPDQRASVAADIRSQGMEVRRLIEQAASFSTDGQGVTRYSFTNAHRNLLDWFAELSVQYGYQYSIDDIGNARFRKVCERSAAPTILIGAHQDTLAKADRFVGIAGVLISLIAVKQIEDLPFNIEVIALADEQGVRFGDFLSSSAALAGHRLPETLEKVDATGVSYQSAMHRFGLNPKKISSAAIKGDRLQGFIEVSVERDGKLSELALPLGVVGSITGIERYKVRVNGLFGNEADHQDALVIASKIVTRVNDLCQRTSQLIGVVGKLDVFPNATSRVPEIVNLSIDLRSPSESIQSQASQELCRFLEGLAGVSYCRDYKKSGIDCNDKLISVLSDAVSATGVEPHVLFSSMAHSSLELASVMPCGSLLVRSTRTLQKGDSSVTNELGSELDISEQDCGLAVMAIKQAIGLLANQMPL